ncbi:MAG: carboxylating nicotinate-nucleotide diphosphorylase [bacterium]
MINWGKALPIIKLALEEDRVFNDITTNSLLFDKRKVKGRLISGDDGIICGLSVVGKIFDLIDKKVKARKEAGVKFKPKVKDGDKVKRGQAIAEIDGLARTILAGERAALNFLQRLSGIATLTGEYVGAVKPYKVKIYDTRKTTPGLRYLEKYAVRCGGGYNHRMHLAEMVLLKDNHLQMLDEVTLLSDMLKKMRKKIPSRVQIEVEAENLGQIREALEAGVDVIMLDNMSLDKMKEAVTLIKTMKYKDKPLIEVSGGVNSTNVSKIARLGIDRISVGALTHSAPALDISLEIIGRK